MMKKKKYFMPNNLHGVLLIVVGAIIGGVISPVLGFPLLFVGAFFFASFPDEQIFFDYYIVEGCDSSKLLIRQRIGYIPIVPLFSSFVRVPYRTNYYKIDSALLQNEHITLTDDMLISKTEYRALKVRQRELYSENKVPAEIVLEYCKPAEVDLVLHKRKYVIAIVLLCLGATMFTEPAAFWMALMYEAIFAWMLIVYAPEYKDAKIKNAAYEHALALHKESVKNGI